MRQVILGLVCLLPLYSMAAATVQQQIAECASVLDAQSRLRCYDQIAANLRQSPAPAAAPTAKSTTDTRVTDASNLAAPAAETASETAATVASQVAASSAAATSATTATTATAAKVTAEAATAVPDSSSTPTAEQEFGLEHKQVIKEEAPDKVEVVIQSKNKDAYGYWKLTLADGQVWKQTDSRRFRFSNPDGSAYIKRGMMGAFYLGEAEHNRTMKVKRLK